MRRPADRPRLPGWRLRAIAQKLCAPATLQHLVDPIVADLQHEWSDAGEARLRRGWVRLSGSIALAKALTLHGLLVAGSHLARNAFGATPEERGFHRRALGGAFGALGVAIVLMALVGSGQLIHSLVYVLTHQRWPGPPTAAEVLPSAIAIALDPAAQVHLLPALAANFLPASLLFAILVALGPRAGEARPAIALAPLFRRVGAFALLATLLEFGLLGWIVPLTNQRYREILMDSITMAIHHSRAVSSAPARGLRELTFPELAEAAGAADRRGGPGASQPYRMESQRRLAWPAACLSFALLGLALAAQRPWSHAQAAAITLGSALVFNWGALRYTERAIQFGVLPSVAVWGCDVALAIAALALILRSRRKARASLTGA
jgi:hypothetical protein